MKIIYYVLIIIIALVIFGVTAYEMTHISMESCDAKGGRYVDVAFSNIGCYDNETNEGRVTGDILCRCRCCVPK